MSQCTERVDHNPLDSWATTWLLAVSLLIGLVLVGETHTRGIDPDELEHLHASYMVWTGAVPYRDFFEHHTPALYYAAQPLFWVCGAEIKVLWLARLIMIACGMGTLCLTLRLAACLLAPRHDPRAILSQSSRAECLSRGSAHRAARLVPWMAVALLAWSSIFHLKTLEFRPDGPATLLLMAAALQVVALREAPQKTWRVLLAGCLAGLATLFTQKSIVPAAGMVLWMLTDSLESRREHLLKQIFLFAVGGAVPWLLTIAAFATWGAADDLLHSTVYRLWAWPLRSHKWSHLRPTLAADLTIWAAALLEILCLPVALVQSFFQRDKSSGRRPPFGWVGPVVATAWCIFSLVWVKAAYAQFYLLWFPWLAILAARRLMQIVECASVRWLLVWVAPAALVLAMLQEQLWLRAELLGEDGALPWLSQTMRPATYPVAWAFLLLFAGAVFAASQGRRGAAVTCLSLLGMVYSLFRFADAYAWPNDLQVETMHAIQTSVKANGRVLDGFTGLGALRQHSLYWWWINDYSWQMMSEAERTGILETLKKLPPEAVLYDAELRRLPEPVKDWIESHYRPTGMGALWLPNEEFAE